GNGGTDVATVTITVDPVNDAPTGTAAPISTDEDTAISGAVVTNDIDGDTVVATLSTAPTNGTVIVNSDGTYTYTPASDYVGSDSFVVLLDDGNGGTSTVSVSATIGAINDNPVAADDAQTTDEDVAVNGAVTLSDVDGDTVTASLGTAPTNGTATVNSDGTYTYTPNADFNGTDTFTVSANDGNGGTDVATVTITVDAVNDAPVAADESQTTDEDVAVNGAVALSDVDGDTVTASLGTAPTNGTVSVNTDGT
ncbi:MAG: tandem-95 repeat protein, partial [Hyphomonas sp.]